MKFLLIFLKIFLLLIPKISSNPTTLKNLQILIERKFQNYPDSYLDDPYYKPDAEFLRSSNRTCIYNKLNLTDNKIITNDDLKNFNDSIAFGRLAEDFHTLAIYVMYSCIDDVDEFSKHFFARNIREPVVEIPRECIECVKNELLRLGVEKPLISHFGGLKDHSVEQCKEILKELKKATRSDEGEFRGCLKIYDKVSREFYLKFNLMKFEKVDEKIYEIERKRHEKISREVCEKFVKCMIDEYLGK